MTYDFYSFSSEEPDLDVFDTSLCIPAADYYVLTLKIDIGGNRRFSTLRKNIRKAFATYTGMELLQIGNIKVCVYVCLRRMCVYMCACVYVLGLSP